VLAKEQKKLKRWGWVFTNMKVQIKRKREERGLSRLKL
jgi:hypothetical protein